MKDKRLKEPFNHMSNQELIFSKEDRDEVFEKLHQMEKNNIQKKSLGSISKKFAPLTVSLLAVGLCLIFFIPTIFQGNANEEFNPSVASGPVVEEAEFSTTLITVKSKEMDNRTYLNLLLTYNKDKKMMNVVSIPYDTMADNKEGITKDDKLLFAYSAGGAEKVRTTVSKLLDLPVDYHAVIDLETISTLIDGMNGIDYELQEAIRVRAITQVAFEFEKGIHRLNGEEVVALMMDATLGESLDEVDLLNLMNDVMNKIENEIPPTQLKKLFTQIEANVSSDYYMLENQIEINLINSVSLSDRMISEHIPLSSTEGLHYYKFEKEFLNSVTDELTTFN